MPVSLSSSRAVYDALKDGGIRLISALPETWLVHLIRMAEDDPEMTLVRLAKEEEGVGISAQRITGPCETDIGPGYVG
jgi:sulfopyruvate decarboxylase subunit alpha